MNDVQIQELIEAIEKLSQKGWVDYLIIIVPILLSVIAVWISLATAHKQNKIALFDMRYRALRCFCDIAEIEGDMGYDDMRWMEKAFGDDVIAEKMLPGITETTFTWVDRRFGTDFLRQVREEQKQKEMLGKDEIMTCLAQGTYYFLESSVDRDTLPILFLADKEQALILNEMKSAFLDFLFLLTMSMDNKEKAQRCGRYTERLHTACEAFRAEKTYDKLLKKIQP